MNNRRSSSEPLILVFLKLKIEYEQYVRVSTLRYISNKIIETRFGRIVLLCLMVLMYELTLVYNSNIR